MANLPFHISLPCFSISKTKDFYSNVLGAAVGRNSHQWLDIDLYGNQMTFTKSGAFDFSFKSYKFEDAILPSFHFGVIVDQETWTALFDKLKASDHSITGEVIFLKDRVGQHISFFIEDPNGYTVEFKSFKDPKEIFG